MWVSNNTICYIVYYHIVDDIWCDFSPFISFLGCLRHPFMFTCGISQQSFCHCPNNTCVFKITLRKADLISFPLPQCYRGLWLLRMFCFSLGFARITQSTHGYTQPKTWGKFCFWHQKFIIKDLMAPEIKSYIAPDWEEVFHCPLWLKVSSVFHLWC